jgi:hypothetical protein
VTLSFHVDESADTGYHFHAGLLSDGAGVAAVERGIKDIVWNAFDAGLCRWEAEVHAVPIFHGNDDWLKGRPDIDGRVQVLDELLGLLSLHGIEVIARGTQLASFKRKYGGSPYIWNFSNLLERLNERLRARDEYGLVIADQQHQFRDRLQKDLADAHEYGTGGYRSSRLRRIVDTVHFVDSRHSGMTQLVDVVAFVLRRRASVRTERDPRLEAVMARWHQLVVDAVPDPSGQYLTVRTS